MEENPKRIKKKDNPYTIKKEGTDYIVYFKDSLGVLQEVKITEDIYAIFDEYELEEKREMNEFDRHIEHSEIYEDNLVLRAKEKTISIEDEFIQKSTFEELKKAIDMLPEIQKRRVKKYYFEELNTYQIAKLEGVAHQVIDRSIKNAINNLRKILKNLK